MAKIIALFNHKGGVSKTTTTFNLGWSLALRGKKVLIVDADPQCNLTGLVLDYNEVDDFEQYYSERPLCDLYNAVTPVLNGRQEPLEAAETISTGNPNLDLLGGNIELSESETQISVALTTGSAIPAIRNIPGCFGQLLRLTADSGGYDYVLVDMSPSVGALNQCLLMSSDYFIVPTFPDFFCEQAVRSLSRVLPSWNASIAQFRSEQLECPVPSSPPKFLGIISQKFRPRFGAPVQSFQKWIDRIKSTVDSRLVPALDRIGMTIDADKFQSCLSDDTPFNLANVADFNSLIAQSQKFNTPVFALTDGQIEQQGVVLEKMKANRKVYFETFDRLSSGLECLVG